MASKQQTTTLGEYRIVNEDDYNCDFIVQASSHDEAIKEALTCLGWFVVAPDDKPPDD